MADFCGLPSGNALGNFTIRRLDVERIKFETFSVTCSEKTSLSDSQKRNNPHPSDIYSYSIGIRGFGSFDQARMPFRLNRKFAQRSSYLSLATVATAANTALLLAATDPRSTSFHWNRTKIPSIFGGYT
ncbi:hypothetical protein WG66_007859 [Moniliophthora roreri]|nr:hypothetical protein WG66_007859 [Moniliophthora roreri]